MGKEQNGENDKIIASFLKIVWQKFVGLKINE